MAKSRRTIALPPVCVAALQQHRRRQLEERMKLGAAWKDSPFLFLNVQGGPLDARNTLRVFHVLLAAAGLLRKRFHDLRHMSAALLLAQGVELLAVSWILGHSEIRVTADVYAHLLSELTADAASKMEAALTTGSESRGVK